MFRYVTYSSILHIGVISFLIFGSLFRSAPKDYYMVDFMAGGGGGGAGRQGADEPIQTKEAVQPKEVEAAKVKTVNPDEDLLLKSKDKKKKKEREVVSKTMPIPAAIPIPKPLESNKEGAGRVPGAIPSVGSGTGEGSSVGAGSGSGIGIGVGDGMGSGTGTGGAGNFPYAWYVHSVKKKLDSNWNVTGGFDRRIYTQMAFTINRNGSVSDIDVEESSKNPAFDLAARRAVEYSNPLPPLPSGYDEPTLRIHVRFTVKN